MIPSTRFTDPAAVEAWDAWFRWRDSSGLRDRTIESTWRRVADTIAAVEGVQAPLWAYRFVDAFSHWRLLPDERLIRVLGTDAKMGHYDSLHAVLNIAAFVSAPLPAQMRIDLGRLVDTAALAVRLLDDAQLAIPRDGSEQVALRIGVIGMAGALELLGIAYDSAQASEVARNVAIAIANGTLRGSIELACERGGTQFDRASLVALWNARDTSVSLVEDALRWGVRRVQLTAIEPQPRLALFANNTSDALDPVLSARRAQPPGSPVVSPILDPGRVLTAQVALRGAMQPWIDTQIDYPLATLTEPDAEAIASSAKLAEQYGLPPPRFRHAGIVHA